MKRNFSITLIVLFNLFLISPTMNGQKFNVGGFRMLPYDVSAFIDPVTDLNGNDCALLKIQGSEDFAFSSPLGIVKRVDNVGEIWLYIPRGSKKITIKHPEWGILRDYIFPVKIDSHMTYEMQLKEPEENIKKIEVKTVVNTVRDTLVVTRVDTLLMIKPKIRYPFTFSTLATAGFGGKSNTVTGGLMLIAMRKHGGWIHVQSNFGKIGNVSAICNQFGAIGNYTPYYTGEKKHSCFLVSAGAIHMISPKINIFEGIGYGYNNLAWKRSDKEGGGYIKNSYFSNNGILFEVGVSLSIKNIIVSTSINSIVWKQWFGSIGIGYKFN